MMSDPHQWLVRPSHDGVTCCLVGDINLQGRAEPRSVFAHLRGTLLDTDVLFGNLEGCLYRAGENDIPGKTSWRHSDASMISALTSVGFDAVGCANNVMFGEEATLATLRVLRENGIAHCGAGRNRQAARAPVLLEKRGVRFGFLQYTARLQSQGQSALADRSGVASFDPKRREDLDEIYGDVRSLRPLVDVVIVSHHLRRTGLTMPESYQREFARACVDAGADVVFGHGAHVNQGIEMWNDAPIFHCVGQLAFDWSPASDHREGLLVRLVIEAGRISCVTALFLYRDIDNNPYLADPGSHDGRRQLEHVRDQSQEGLSLRVERGELLVKGHALI